VDTGEFPNIARIIPEFPRTGITLKLKPKDLKQALPFLKVLGPSTVKARFDTGMTLSTTDGGAYSAAGLAEANSEQMDIAFNAKYLHDAFQFFADCDLTATLEAYNPLRPVLLSAGAGVKYVVTPIRVM
jgi:DNA polymerase sliding clamp subunit (PCNA homolog)